MDTFLYYLAVILGLMIVFFVGTVYGWSLHQRLVARRIGEAVASLSQQYDQEIIEINIEKHDGVIYVYDKKTKQFMAQGKTRAEIESVLAEKYPGKRFAAPSNDLETGFSK